MDLSQKSIIEPGGGGPRLLKSSVGVLEHVSTVELSLLTDESSLVDKQCVGDEGSKRESVESVSLWHRQEEPKHPSLTQFVPITDFAR
jgi:hypothetical protein